MTISNKSVKHLLNALEELRCVAGVDVSLERASIAHKIKALIGKERSPNIRGIELIDDMSDEELTLAIATQDKRLGLFPHMTPEIFNYLRRHRMQALEQAEALKKKENNI